MKNTITFLFCLIGIVAFSKEKNTNPIRIITLNGAITEMVCALGHQDKIVATDVTSTFPKSLNAKDLGHVRTLSIESVMALKPTLILATEKDMNPDLAAKLKASGVKTHIFKQVFSIQGTKDLIKEVATVLGEKNYAALQSSIDKKVRFDLK